MRTKGVIVSKIIVERLLREVGMVGANFGESYFNYLVCEQDQDNTMGVAYGKAGDELDKLIDSYNVKLIDLDFSKASIQHQVEEIILQAQLGE